MPDLVSVITPTYNRAYCVTQAIDSALAQTWTELEIIVLDDGSTDDTRALVAERYAGEPRVRYFFQENRGVVAARNAAFDRARGQYLAFLDSDDAWKPWKLELQLACLKSRRELGMVWSDMEAVGPDGSVIEPRYLRTMYAAYKWFSVEQLFDEHIPLRSLLDLPEDCEPACCLHLGDIYSPMAMGNLVHTSTVLLTRERFEKVRCFDEDLGPAGEDYDFHFRTAREGRVGFIDLPTIRYQVGMADRLTRHSHAMARNFLKVLQRALEQDRERITLPAWMIRESVANAHGWLAETLVEEGQRAEARRHYLQSLRNKPWQPRALAQVALGMMPPSLDRGLRQGYQRVKLARSQTR